jgi:predicted anti-sigma-YlaC factor YlaD
MSGVTYDFPYTRYGTADGHQGTSNPLGASQTVYVGEVALLSGSGSVSTGFLKNAATPGSADLVVGMINTAAGGTYVPTQPGITNSGADGAVWVNIATGTFFFQSGTGSDQLTQALVGNTVYYGGENTSGPLAFATSHSSTLPVLGVLAAQDPSIANGAVPGPNYWPVTLNVKGV